MTNHQRSHVLYTGITGDLPSRVFEHKHKLSPGFTSRHNLTRFVYCETFGYPGDAIQREKEIKSWVRSKKTKLIDRMNPHWHDLAADREDLYKPVNRTPLPIHARSFTAGRPRRMTSSEYRWVIARSP
jgi:putative endonuclease